MYKQASQDSGHVVSKFGEHRSWIFHFDEFRSDEEYNPDRSEPMKQIKNILFEEKYFYNNIVIYRSRNFKVGNNGLCCFF